VRPANPEEFFAERFRWLNDPDDLAVEPWRSRAGPTPAATASDPKRQRRCPTLIDATLPSSDERFRQERS
jgi:hypothetical protein